MVLAGCGGAMLGAGVSVGVVEGPVEDESGRRGEKELVGCVVSII